MASTTRGWVLRSEQAYCLQLCEKETLDYGIAYYSERFRDHPDANQFREVLIEDAANTDAAIAQAEAWFRDRGLECRRWALAEAQSPDVLDAKLAQHGFRRRMLAALALTKWVELPAPADVRVLPARAMRAAFRETLQWQGDGFVRVAAELFREVYEERLNDPQLEIVIALVEKKAVGRCGFYQIGDIARVMDLTVAPEFAERGVAQALLGNVLGLAKRLALRNVGAAVPSDDQAQLALMEQAGFVRDGEIVEFVRD